MRKLFSAIVVGVFVLVGAAIPSRAAIQGDYVEVRSADIYTGPCFANSQVDLEGKQAILGWKINHGTWKGVSLDGLGVVAVVKAHATLGDPYRDPYPAKSVLIVDERASSAQRRALEEFARAQAGRLLAHVVLVEAAPIHMTVGQGNEHGSVDLTAGHLAQVKTRSLCRADDICGNEEIYYPPLTRLSHSMPAYAEVDSFQGKGLGVIWDRLGARSAFVGSFTL
jgi:Protein of unknown function (DUF1326)